MYSLQTFPSKFFGYSCQFLRPHEQAQTATVSKAWHGALPRISLLPISLLPKAMLPLFAPYLGERDLAKFISVNKTMRDAVAWSIHTTMKTNEDLAKLLISNLDRARFSDVIENLQSLILPRSLNISFCFEHIAIAQRILIGVLPKLMNELEILVPILLQDFHLATNVKNNIINFIKTRPEIDVGKLTYLYNILIVLGGVSESIQFVKENGQPAHLNALIDALTACGEPEQAANLLKYKDSLTKG